MFGKLVEASSSSSMPLTPKTSPDSKKLKRACIEDLWHSDNFGLPIC